MPEASELGLRRRLAQGLHVLDNGPRVLAAQRAFERGHVESALAKADEMSVPNLVEEDTLGIDLHAQGIGEIGGAVGCRAVALAEWAVATGAMRAEQLASSRGGLTASGDRARVALAVARDLPPRVLRRQWGGAEREKEAEGKNGWCRSKSRRHVCHRLCVKRRAGVGRDGRVEAVYEVVDVAVGGVSYNSAVDGASYSASARRPQEGNRLASAAASLAIIRSSVAAASSASTSSPSRFAGTAHVMSSGRIPVRARLSAHPTLATICPCSFAMATMWHCGCCQASTTSKLHHVGSHARTGPRVRNPNARD